MPRRKNEGAGVSEADRIEARRRQAVEEARLPADSPAVRGAAAVVGQTITGLNQPRTPAGAPAEAPKGAGRGEGTVRSRSGAEAEAEAGGQVTVDRNQEA